MTITMTAIRPVQLLVLCGLILVFSMRPAVAEDKKDDMPAAARITLAKAGKLMNDRDYEKAIALLADFQAKAPAGGGGAENTESGHAEILYALGTCHLLQDHFQQAAQTLERAVQHDPRHLSAWLNLAKAAYELSDYRKAAECFARAYELGPEKNPEHLYFSAVVLFLAKQNDQAVAAFERLLATTPDIRPEWRENLIHVLLAAGENHRALPHIRSLAEEYRDDKQRQWQEILLHHYLQLDMDVEALAYAESLSAKSPAEPKWWRALAHIHLRHNRYQPALTALLIAGYLEPLSDQESRLVADLYLQLGVPVKAAALYQDILSDKGNPQLLANLVVALQQTGQAEEALTALGKFAPETPGPELAMLKADLLYGLGRYRTAAQLYRQTAESGGKEKARALRMAEYAKTRESFEYGGNERHRRGIAF
ncbi:MAG: hypothetical protein ACD_75C02554G0005 [uncultured bacterium]|nr:MAG: hypothetical protein ACD_75C02554G0005 [uncultured bacterium]